MKTAKRFILGAISSLFLAVGLVRAADQLDPLSRSLSVDAAVNGSAPDSTAPCDANTNDR
jgi:hypothetical protein